MAELNHSGVQQGVCQPHMKDRAEVLTTMKATWMIFIGKSWLQTSYFSMLQLLNPQHEPFNAKQWYNYSLNDSAYDLSENILFTDTLFDGHGHVIRQVRVASTARTSITL
jgi:hypothetical protein